MAETIFSRIIAGEIPCAKVYEDEHTFAFMDAGQVNPGHVLVASRTPAETLLDLDEEAACALFRTVYRMARRVDARFKPAGLTVLQTNKPAGWQSVPHVHVHVLPRHADDGVEVTWPQKNPPMEALQKLADDLRAGS